MKKTIIAPPLTVGLLKNQYQPDRASAVTKKEILLILFLNIFVSLNIP